MRTIQITTAGARYPVHIGDGALARLHRILRPRKASAIFIITSPRILTPWRRQLLHSLGPVSPHPHIISIPSGEQHKTLKTIESLAEQLARLGASRNSLLIAFGGGVVGDITGFLAATFMRGINYLQIPTTLLAQVDSSVGGKTGVNLKAGKNLIGSFNPPAAVIADTQFLQTLPLRELRAGMYESIKAAIVGDPALFSTLEDHRAEILARDTHLLEELIVASVRVKARIVMQDEHEKGARMALNLGHTLGHAIEAATHYRQLLHGEAVAWGIRLATEIARKRGALPEKDAARIDQLILSYGRLPAFSATSRRIVHLTYGDKKNVAHQRRFILPVAIGRTIIASDVTDAEMSGALRHLRTS